MDVNVRKEGQIPAGSPWKQGTCQVQRNTVNINPQQLPKPDIPLCHQCQRSQKVLAELAIRHPWLTFPVLFKGQGVNQNRTPLVKLDIVGAGVLERHPQRQCFLLNSQRGKRSIFQLAEAPFIGVGYKSNPDWFDNQGGKVGNCRFRLHFLVGDEQVHLHKAGIQTRIHQHPVIRFTDAVDLPEQVAVTPEKKSAGIPERGSDARLTPGHASLRLPPVLPAVPPGRQVRPYFWRRTPSTSSSTT